MQKSRPRTARLKARESGQVCLHGRSAGEGSDLLPSRHSPSGTNVTQTRDKAPDSSVRPPAAGFFAVLVVLLLLPAKEDLNTGFCPFSGERAKERRNVQIVGRVRSPSLSGRSKIEPMQPPAPGVPGSRPCNSRNFHGAHFPPSLTAHNPARQKSYIKNQAA